MAGRPNLRSFAGNPKELPKTRNVKKTILTIVCTLSLFLAATAQKGTLIGTIVQRDSSTALSGVSVYLDGTHLGTATNSRGQYVIKDIPPGEYTLVVSNIGYFTLRSQIHIRANEMLKADLTMIEAISTLAEVTIMTGGSLGLKDIPGSVHYISPKEIERFSYTDINRTLRTVPGINVQEEDGFGLRPNIGLRGTGVERSSKITVMEDGVLSAPAPYSAPAAYYFPTIGRMQAIEILKGSSQIKYGPYTTGGAINLISTYIPHEFGGKVSLLGGSFEGRSVHAFVGNAHKNFGYVVETFQYGSDGFKQLDNGGQTGFDKKDYLVKFRISTNPAARVYQSLTFKAGQATETSEETYLGLTQEDFNSTPYRRYAASQKDVMKTKHAQYSLTHLVQFPKLFDITTTAYHSDFSRNWYKLDKVKNSLGNKISIASLLEDPSTFDDAYAILGGAGSTFDDALEVKANNRSYDAGGIQTVLRTDFHTGKMQHDVEIGLRYHEDQVDRYQWADYYAMEDGVMKLTSVGTPGTESNTIESAQAIAAYLQYKLRVGHLTMIPGLRSEHITMSAQEYGKNDPDRIGTQLVLRSNTVNVLIPGIGVDFQFNDYLSVFAGVHKGFAPPGSHDETVPEKSVNYELGLRYTKNRVSGQLVGFFNDYGNLLGSDLAAAGGGGTGDLFNGGEVKAKGIEFQMQYELLAASTQGFSLPLSVVYTYTDAVFLNAFESDFEGWGEVARNDELPYLAHHQCAVVLGIEHHTFSVHVSGRYMDAMRTQPGQGEILANEKTDMYFVCDASANYKVHQHLSLFINSTNLTDQIYVVARRPAGLRPGMPRAFNAGVKAVF